MQRLANPLKTLAVVVTIAAGITGTATFFLTRFAYHEEQGESRGKLAQRVEDRLDLLEKYQLDHAATHQAIERDLHGAVLVGAQTQDLQKETQSQINVVAAQVSALTREVRRSQSQIAEIGKLRIDLSTTSDKVETLGQRLNKLNESVDELTKGLKKRAKKDEKVP